MRPLIKDNRISGLVTYPIRTPGFVFDESRLLAALATLKGIQDMTGCKTLFALKSSPLIYALHLMAPHMDGFSTSSMFEAKIARAVVGIEKSVHITTPGLSSDEVDGVSELCDYISFNSLSQWERYHERVKDKMSCGLRVNPQLPFVEDERYNPCRKGSKLGTPLNKLSEISNNGFEALKEVKGLHFHTNCESTDIDQLFRTVLHIDTNLPRLLGQVNWVNLGGGYLFEEGQNFDKLVEAIDLLRVGMGDGAK